MEVTQVIEASIVKLEINGELDASTTIEMDTVLKTLLEAGSVNIIFDCTNLSYISSAGVGVFISFVDDFKDKGGNFGFYNMQENVHQVFTMLGLDGILSIVAREEEAKAMF